VSALSFPFVPLDVPVDPDAPEARRWILEELEKSKYGNAKPAEPGWLDEWLNGFRDWLISLFDGLADPQGAGGSPVWGVILVVVIAAALVVAFLLFGVPRLNRRSRLRELFGDDDERDATTLRRSASAAAAAGDYATAIGDLYRSLARGLAERTLVSTSPGTTAHGFARQAAAVFPDAAGRLASAADVFDGVRYLGAPGTAEQWTTMSALERDLRSATPARAAVDPVGAR